MTLGETIKYARTKKGITQKELAKALQVSETFISQYERDKRNPKIETLQKIADALDINISELTIPKVDLNKYGYKVLQFSDEKENEIINSIVIKSNELVEHMSFDFSNIEEKKAFMQLIDKLYILNTDGIKRVAEYANDLTKISEYRKSETDASK